MAKICSLLVLILSAQFVFAAAPVQMNPALEGIYSVQFSCPAGTPNCQAKFLFPIDRMSIINTPGGRFGLWLTFASTVDGAYSDTFVGVQVGPQSNQLTGVPLQGMSQGESGGPFAYVNMTIDSLTGSFSGTVIDQNILGTLLITGKKIDVLGDLLALGLSSQVTSLQLTGSYHGTLGAEHGELLVMVLPTGQIVAKFTNPDNDSITFTTGIWDPGHAVLKLQFSNPRFFAMGEALLTVATDPHGRILLRGHEISLFADEPMSFTHD